MYYSISMVQMGKQDKILYFYPYSTCYINGPFYQLGGTPLIINGQCLSGYIPYIKGGVCKNTAKIITFFFYSMPTIVVKERNQRYIIFCYLGYRTKFVIVVIFPCFSPKKVMEKEARPNKILLFHHIKTTNHNIIKFSLNNGSYTLFIILYFEVSKH